MNHSIDKITTPSGEIRYELRLWERGRRAHQIKRRFNSRKDAVNFLDERVRAEKGESLEDDARTFGQEYAHWRAENERSFSPGWRLSVDGYWREMGPALESVKLSKLKSALAEHKTKWAELSDKTVSLKLGFVHAVLNFSVAEKRITVNPLGSLVRGKAQPEEIEFWERQEAEAFLAFMAERYLPGTPERWRFAAVFTALNTAVRAGELWGLKLTDLKPSHSSIRLTRQFNRVSRSLTQLKGKEARSVPMTQDLFAELSALPRHRGDMIFARFGKPIDHDAYRELFDADVAAWGGRRITFHGLRHTAATLMLLSGVSVKDLQVVMGHKHISTTMRYVHAIGDEAKRVSQAFSVNAKASGKVLRLAEFG